MNRYAAYTTLNSLLVIVALDSLVRRGWGAGDYTMKQVVRFSDNRVRKCCPCEDICNLL